MNTLQKHIPLWHYGMLRDLERTQFYEDIIQKNCAGKLILEIGSGSGLLCVLALKHGAKHVYAVESNSQLAECSEKLVRRLGLQDRFTLFNINSRKLTASDLPPVDIILHEIFGSDPFGEFVIPSLTAAKKFLKPGGIFLPESIHLTFRPRTSKHIPPLVYKDIELSETLDLFKDQYPALSLEEVKDGANLFVTSEIKLSELIDTQNFNAVIVSDHFKGASILEVAFIIKHAEDSILSYEIGSKSPVKHWSPFLIERKNPKSPEVVFTLEDHSKLVCL